MLIDMQYMDELTQRVLKLDTGTYLRTYHGTQVVDEVELSNVGAEGVPGEINDLMSAARVRAGMAYSGTANVVASTNPLTGGIKYSVGVGGNFFLPSSASAVDMQNCIDKLSQDGGGSLFLDAAVYDVGDTKITLKSGVSLIGVKGRTKIKSSQIINIIEITTGSDMSISGVMFESTMIDAVENYYGLVYSNNSAIDGVSITDCQFTAPNANVNGLKFVAETDGVVVKKVIIERCVFYRIGRMGIEFQNHNSSPVADRYINVAIRQCRFDTTGLLLYGMGVSFSGRGSMCRVESCEFIDCVQVGVEMIGVQNAVIIGNVFAGTIGRIVQAANSTPMSGITIANNATSGRVVGGELYLMSMINPLVCGNNIKSTVKTQISSNGTKFTANLIDTTDVYSVIVDNAADVTVSDNTLRNNESASSYATLRLNNAGTIRCLVTNNRLHIGNGGVFIDQTAGAAGNVLSQNWASDGNLYPVT